MFWAKMPFSWSFCVEIKPIRTCVLYGLNCIPATQFPPFGQPSCKGFYPHEAYCESCSRQTPTTTSATSEQADSLCKKKKKRCLWADPWAATLVKSGHSRSYRPEPLLVMLGGSEWWRKWQDLCGRSDPAEHHTCFLRCLLSPGGPRQGCLSGGGALGRTGKPSLLQLGRKRVISQHTFHSACPQRF